MGRGLDLSAVGYVCMKGNSLTTRFIDRRSDGGHTLGADAKHAYGHAGMREPMTDCFANPSAAAGD
jgi:hypothetical protein